jgi:hypothetical protein
VFAGLPLICEQSQAIEPNHTLVAERRTGRPLIESDGRRSTECVTPDHIYEVVFIEFRLTTGSVRPVRLRKPPQAVPADARRQPPQSAVQSG